MKRQLKLRLNTRVNIMNYLDQGIDEIDQLKERIDIKEEPRISSDKQLSRCITSIKGHHTLGHRPRRVQGSY